MALVLGFLSSSCTAATLHSLTRGLVPPHSAPRTSAHGTGQFWPDSVAFWNKDRGILGGSFEKNNCYSRCAGAIAVSRDGGQSWRVALRTRRPVDFVSMFGE